MLINKNKLWIPVWFRGVVGVGACWFILVCYVTLRVGAFKRSGIDTHEVVIGLLVLWWLAFGVLFWHSYRYAPRNQATLFCLAAAVPLFAPVMIADGVNMLLYSAGVPPLLQPFGPVLQITFFLGWGALLVVALLSLQRDNRNSARQSQNPKFDI